MASLLRKPAPLTTHSGRNQPMFNHSHKINLRIQDQIPMREPPTNNKDLKKNVSGPGCRALPTHRCQTGTPPHHTEEFRLNRKTPCPLTHHAIHRQAHCPPDPSWDQPMLNNSKKVNTSLPGEIPMSEPTPNIENLKTKMLRRGGWPMVFGPPNPKMPENQAPKLPSNFD